MTEKEFIEKFYDPNEDINSGLYLRKLEKIYRHIKEKDCEHNNLCKTNILLEDGPKKHYICEQCGKDFNF